MEDVDNKIFELEQLIVRLECELALEKQKTNEIMEIIKTLEKDLKK